MLTAPSALFVCLLILFLVQAIDMNPVMKSGYSKNHQFFRSKSDTPDSSNGFWANVYFVITASDSFFGG